MVKSSAPLSQTIARLQNALGFYERRHTACGESAPFQEALEVLKDLRAVREGAKRSPPAAAATSGQRE